MNCWDAVTDMFRGKYLRRLYSLALGLN